jgi:Ubiquitin family
MSEHDTKHQARTDPQRVRVHIDEHRYESPNPNTGAALYVLAKIHQDHQLFREVEGDREDEPIGFTGNEIRLREDEHFHSADAEHAALFTVEVLYDGVKKPFVVRPNETVKQLLDQAIKAFGPLPNPHMLSLYLAGKELPDAETLKQAGVKPNDVLLLRPSTVKGGV